MASIQQNLTLAGLVTTLLCAMPSSVQAAPELTASAKAAPKGQTSAYRQGKQAALAGDSEGAVQAWAKVLEATPETVKTRRFRMQLIVDTINVALDAHATAPNLALLEHTLDIYYAYFSAYEKQYGNPHIPKPVVNARFDLKSAIDIAEKDSGADPAVVPAAARDAPEPEPPAPSAAPPPSSSPTVSLSTSETSGNGTGLLIGGGVALVAAAGASSLIAVGAINGNAARSDADNPDYSDDQRRRINGERKKANTLFIVGVASTPVLLAAGGVLVGLGAKRMTASRRGYALAPTVTPTFAGVQFQGRF